jgi:intracellular multiplication protein IcmL
MLGSRHEIARLQSDFYRDQFRKILRWLIASVFVVLALIACIVYLVLVEPTQHYYANTSEGRILAMP